MKMGFLVWLAVLLAGCRASSLPEPGEEEASEATLAELRQQMVEEQLAGRDIEDPEVLEAMGSVPRHEFVPETHRHRAYADRPLPIGHNQTISQPYIVALMTERLQLEPDDRVLEIGTGSGYQAAILGELAAEVYTIEIIPALGQRAEKTLQRLGYDNVHVKIGNGHLGWPENAPFDAIIVTAAPDDIPEPLVEQLQDGGRMIIPVGGRLTQTLYLLRKKGDDVEKESVVPVRFVPMTGDGASGDGK